MTCRFNNETNDIECDDRQEKAYHRINHGFSSDGAGNKLLKIIHDETRIIWCNNGNDDGNQGEDDD